MDADFKSILENGVEAVTRLTDLIEKAIEQPAVEIEIPPPICPHCRTINPKITVAEAEATGNLAEFILLATCLKCKKRFYAFAIVWSTHKTHNEIKINVQTHLERVFGNGQSGNVGET